MTERDRAAGRLLLERGLASSDALRRCAQATQERRQRGEQIEVLQVLVEQGALDRSVASSLWRELQGSGAAPRPAPDSGRLAPPQQNVGFNEAPTLRGNFNVPDSTPTIGPGAIAQNMPGFPGAPPQGFGSGSFNAPPQPGFGPPPTGGFGPPPTGGFGPPPTGGFGPPPAGGFGPPGGGPPGTQGFGPPQGFGSGSFNVPPQPGFGPPQGFGSGSFNAPPQPGFGPPQGFGSGSFNAPPQPGFGPPQGFGSGSFNAPPQPGFNGGPGFGPPAGFAPAPPQQPGFDPTALTIRSPVGGLDAPPVAETVRSPEGLQAEAEDLASTVKQPSDRVGPVDFQSDFDPMGSGFGNGPPPSVAGVAPQSQPSFPVDPGPPEGPAAELSPAPAAPEEEEPKKKGRAGASSRRKKASGRERQVSGRVRAARAKREKKTSPAIFIGAGALLLVLLIVVVAVVANSGSEPQPSPSPEATPSPDAPRETPSEGPPARPTPEASRPPAAASGGGPIPAKYREKGSSAEAPVRAEDLEGDLVALGDHYVEQASYQKAVNFARRALEEWPAWLQGTPAHERYRKVELSRREKQLRFSQHLESLLKTPKAPGVAKMIGAIAGQHLHADLEDLPCVEKFKGDMMEILGEDEYDAIFVQEFDPKELQDDFRDDE